MLYPQQDSIISSLSSIVRFPEVLSVRSLLARIVQITDDLMNVAVCIASFSNIDLRLWSWYWGAAGDLSDIDGDTPPCSFSHPPSASFTLSPPQGHAYWRLDPPPHPQPRHMLIRCLRPSAATASRLITSPAAP